jgi:hypothetical protein
VCVASYPDVMMPAYSANRFFAAFFIVYLSLELYFIMNLASRLVDVHTVSYMRGFMENPFAFQDFLILILISDVDLWCPNQELSLMVTAVFWGTKLVNYE